jgi:hypothetical protein
VKLLAAIFRDSTQKPKGRRWSFEEKMLALSLKTLKSIINTVHFTTSINAYVFGKLRQCLQKMSGKDCFCCLMCDEMPIRVNMRFNQKFDCIEGF